LEPFALLFLQSKKKNDHHHHPSAREKKKKKKKTSGCGHLDCVFAEIIELIIIFLFVNVCGCVMMMRRVCDL
jgi:hypothetical protein